MNAHLSPQSPNESNHSGKIRSKWTISPELWNEDGDDGDNKQPQIGIALQEPNLKEPDVVPMLLGFDGCPAQTIKPISVSLMNKILGFVMRKDVSPADDPAAEDAIAYLEERMDWQ